MKMKRKGWFKEPKRHALSAKGIKNAPNRNNAIKKRMNYSSPFSQRSFERLSRARQRGLIIDLAKKAWAGVKSAARWEKEHLPNQAQWVKDEFKEAKTALSNFAKKEREDPGSAYNTTKGWIKEAYDNAGQNISDFKEELKKAPTIRMDEAEVADEKDHDEDGIPDITDEQLDRVNKKITSEREEELFTELDDLVSRGEGTSKRAKYLFGQLNPPKKKSIGSKVGKFFADKKRKEFESTSKTIREFGTEKEKKLLRGDPDRIDIARLSDKTLEELAIRTEEGLLGGNIYEQEILRRQEKKEELRQKKSELARELAERRKELKERLKGENSLF